MFKAEKIIITGGYGFIGSGFLHWILGTDFGKDIVQIINIDNMTYAGTPKNAPEDSRLKNVTLDISDSTSKSWDKWFNETDLLINFAAESHVDRSIKDCRPFISTNILGTVNLLEAARKNGVKRFVQVSTDEVYGDVKKHLDPSCENDRMKPRNPYSASKAAAEHFVHAFRETHGLDIVITRGSNTYGPRQYPEKIIPVFIKKLLKDEQIPIYGNGGAIRDYMYVDDHCRGIWSAAIAGKSGSTYNLGADQLYTGNQVAEKLLKIFGKGKEYIKYVDDRLGHDFKYHMDLTKAASNIGWQSSIGFDDGLKRTVDWYLKNQWALNR